MDVERLKADPLFGSYAAIARACGLSREAVRKWGKTVLKRVPAEHCRAIEEFSNGKYSRAKLRPDLWDRPRTSRRAA